MKKERKKALAAYECQHNGRCSKCGKNGHNSPDLKCTPPKKKKEKEEKEGNEYNREVLMGISSTIVGKAT